MTWLFKPHMFPVRGLPMRMIDDHDGHLQNQIENCTVSASDGHLIPIIAKGKIPEIVVGS